MPASRSALECFRHSKAARLAAARAATSTSLAVAGCRPAGDAALLVAWLVRLSQARRSLLQAVGLPVMPPYWSLGFQLCRWGYEDLDHMQAAVGRMRQYNIPHVRSCCSRVSLFHLNRRKKPKHADKLFGNVNDDLLVRVRYCLQDTVLLSVFLTLAVCHDTPITPPQHYTCFLLFNACQY